MDDFNNTNIPEINIPEVPSNIEGIDVPTTTGMSTGAKMGIVGTICFIGGIAVDRVVEIVRKRKADPDKPKKRRGYSRLGRRKDEDLEEDYDDPEAVDDDTATDEDDGDAK